MRLHSTLKVNLMPDNPSNNNESFVSRWSRRKQQVAEEGRDVVATKEAIEKVEELDPEQLKAEKLSELNKLTDEDMPDIETLNEDSDFSGFMSTSVSEGLRNLALKKLFMGASYNIRDGLDEYDGDYTKFEKMPKSMVTSDMRHMVEVEAKKKLEKEQEEAKQKMIAAGASDPDGFDEMNEFDEFADEDEENSDSSIVAADEEPTEKYVDEHINVDGFDTTNTDENEEVA